MELKQSGEKVRWSKEKLNILTHKKEYLEQENLK
jgi:hypothetical protein